MLAKITAKNQLTLPKAATQAVGATEYLEVEVRGGQIILTPVRIQRGDAVRAKLAELALTEADVADAVAWARFGAKSPAALAAEPSAAYVARPPAKAARRKATPTKPATKTSSGQ
jgi:antitoxin component of MazEF toxin-antitoxin module